MPGMAPFASEVARSPVVPAPLLGQHTAEVMQCLAVAHEELPALNASGSI
jgi:crotonobetainyl-CoA:carnitine CoA-transferase CaiB-like acyl-CoA transferase